MICVSYGSPSRIGELSRLQFFLDWSQPDIEVDDVQGCRLHLHSFVARLSSNGLRPHRG